MTFKSFENDYKKRFASLKHCDLASAQNVQSYLIENNKYLVIFYRDEYYNVYDMYNDKWLISNNYNSRGLKVDRRRDGINTSRDVLIHDEMIIRSSYKTLYFYFIGSDCIRFPKLEFEYLIQTGGGKRDFKPGSGYLDHGMCIIDYRCEAPKDGNVYETHKIQIQVHQILDMDHGMDLVINVLSMVKMKRLLLLLVDLVWKEIFMCLIVLQWN